MSQSHNGNNKCTPPPNDHRREASETIKSSNNSRHNVQNNRTKSILLDTSGISTNEREIQRVKDGIHIREGKSSKDRESQ
jgi:hypothetical protein